MGEVGCAVGELGAQPREITMREMEMRPGAWLRLARVGAAVAG